jgi:hypothetical protein
VNSHFHKRIDETLTPLATPSYIRHPVRMALVKTTDTVPTGGAMLRSTFTFLGTIFESVFTGVNVSSPTPNQPQLGWTSFNQLNAVLDRSDKEFVLPLDPILKSQFLPVIQNALKNQPQVTFTGGPFAQIALWPQVPYFLSRLPDHPLTTTLLRIYINVHIHTPWPASDADASISYYIFLRLQDGKLKASVDGAWVVVNGGWPVGGQIADKLGSFAKSEIHAVQAGLDSALSAVGNETFKDIYLIPGDGSKAPVIAGNATLATALGLVP